jgi:hypothetical protein
VRNGMATRRSERLGSQQAVNPPAGDHKSATTPAPNPTREQETSNESTAIPVETSNDTVTEQSNDATPPPDPILSPARPIASYTVEELRAFTPAQRQAFKARVEDEKTQREWELEAEALLATARALAEPPEPNAIPVRGGRNEQTNSRNAPTESDALGDPIEIEEPIEAAPRARRRRRESSSSVEERDKKPPTVNVKEFKGDSVDEKMVYDIKMQNHFSRHAWYYNVGNTNHKRILAAEETLSDDVAKKWHTFKRDGHDPENMTWDEFDAFLVRCIKDPRILGIEAEGKVERAVQREWQSVTDFNVYLRSWEQHVPNPLDEAQRKARLRAKILESLRTLAISRHSDEPEDYDRFVVWLQTLEDGMPERQAALRKGRNRRNNDNSGGRGGNTPSTSLGSSQRRLGRAKDNKQQTRGSNREGDRNKSDKPSSGSDNSNHKKQQRDKDVTCGHCGNKGHTELKCWDKHPELRPKWATRK